MKGEGLHFETSRCANCRRVTNQALSVAEGWLYTDGNKDGSILLCRSCQRPRSKRRRQRSAAITISTVIAIIVILGAAIVYLPAFGGISGDALANSVSNELDMYSREPCERKSTTGWSCTVETDGGSGQVGYRVQLNGRCWTAEAEEAYGGGEGYSESACVMFHDQLLP